MTSPEFDDMKAEIERYRAYNVAHKKIEEKPRKSHVASESITTREARLFFGNDGISIYDAVFLKTKPPEVRELLVWAVDRLNELPRPAAVLPLKRQKARATGGFLSEIGSFVSMAASGPDKSSTTRRLRIHTATVRLRNSYGDGDIHDQHVDLFGDGTLRHTVGSAGEFQQLTPGKNAPLINIEFDLETMKKSIVEELSTMGIK